MGDYRFLCLFVQSMGGLIRHQGQAGHEDHRYVVPATNLLLLTNPTEPTDAFSTQRESRFVQCLNHLLLLRQPLLATSNAS